MAQANVPLAPPLGFDLPNELVNYIMHLTLINDRTAVVVPRQLCKIGAARNPFGAIAEENVITSRCGLARANKAARILYLSMFRRKALDLDVDRIIVRIENFDISAFRALFGNLKQRNGAGRAMEFAYDFHMSFRNEYLDEPDKKPLIDFAKTWEPQTAQQFFRFMNITYTIHPISLKYVDKLRDVLNEVFFEREGYADPEFKYLLEVFKQQYQWSQIVKEEDQDKDLVGHWVRGRFLIKERHEWTGDEFKDEEEPMDWCG